MPITLRRVTKPHETLHFGPIDRPNLRRYRRFALALHGDVVRLGLCGECAVGYADLHGERDRMSPQEYREVRVAAGLTQGQLAERLGVTREIINRRERGLAPIKLEQVLALSILVETLKREQQPISQ